VKITLEPGNVLPGAGEISVTAPVVEYVADAVTGFAV
jgi:hypothetical protein